MTASNRHPCLQVTAAELWCLDVDRAALDAAPTPNTLLLPKEDAAEGALGAADLQRIVGRAASDAGGRGNINAGTDGAVTFVLAPAAALYGGGSHAALCLRGPRHAGPGGWELQGGDAGALGFAFWACCRTALSSRL